MDKMPNIVAAIALGLGMSLAAVSGAVAQPKEGCEVSTIDEAATGASASDEHAAVSPETGREEATTTTAEERAEMQGSTDGSDAPMPGMGECDDIDDLGQDEG